MAAPKKYHRVRTVNPAKGKAKPKPKRKPKVAAPKKRRRAPARKAPVRRRRRRTTTAPARRRRRKSNPAPSRRRRAAGAVKGFFGSINLTEPFRDWRPLWVLLGKMGGAFAVRKWGDAELVPGSTATMGGRWTIKNHFLNLLGGYVAGSIIAAVKNKAAGQLAYNGAVDMSVSKAWWHEVVQAIPGGTTYFGKHAMGQLDPSVQALLGRAQAGDTIDDGKGNRYVVQVTAGGEKQMVPMMGLQEATPLDGLQVATPLDGLTVASPLDGYQQRQLQRRERGEIYEQSPTGHLTVGGDVSNKQATYMRRGTDNPYSAAYLGRRY